MLLKTFALYLLCSLLPSLVLARAAEINLTDKVHYLGQHAEYWVPANQNLSLDEVLDPKNNGQFNPVAGKLLNLGVSKLPVWVKVPIRHHSDLEREYFFVTGLAKIDSDVWFIPQNSKMFPLRPGMAGKVYTLDFLPLKANQSGLLVVKAYSDVNLTLQLRLWDIQGFWKNQKTVEAVMALYYGALAIMILFNLIIFWFVKEKIYLYYILSALFYGCFQLMIDRLAAEYIAEFSIYWAVFFAMASGVMSIYFTREYLETKVYLPKIDKGLKGLVWSLVLVIVVGSMLPMSITTNLAGAVGMLAPFILLLVGIKSVRYNRRHSLIYLAAWSVYLMAVVFYSMDIVGLFALTYKSAWTKVGSFFELTLFSIALAERINRVQREKEAAQGNLVEAVSKHSIVLEETVALRTEELEAANRTKDKFFSIIGHDLKGPIISMDLVLTMLKKDKLQMSDQLIDHLAVTTKSTRQLLEDLLDWTLSQQGSLTPQPSVFSLNEPMEEVIALLSGVAEQKRIELINRVEPHALVMADKSMVKTVIRNLVGNALKFSYPGAQVIIQNSSQEDEHRVEIIDYGVGIAEAKQAELFLRPVTNGKNKRGTHEEVGHGFGLHLAWEFIQTNHGKLGVESETGKGSKFWFSLPAAVYPQPESGTSPCITSHAYRVLMFEERPEERKLAMFALSKSNMELELAFDSIELLKKALSGHFEAILLDVDSEGFDGATIAQKLKNQGYSGLIFALSAEPKEGKKGFAACLKKPLDPKILKQQLNQTDSNNTSLSHGK